MATTSQPNEPSPAMLEMTAMKMTAIVRKVLRTMLVRGNYEKVDLHMEVNISNGSVDMVRTGYGQTHKLNSSG